MVIRSIGNDHIGTPTVARCGNPWTEPECGSDRDSRIADDGTLGFIDPSWSCTPEGPLAPSILMRRERKPSPGFFHRRKFAGTSSTSSPCRIGRAVIEIARPGEATDHRLE